MERSRKGYFNLNKKEPYLPIPIPKNRQELEEQILNVIPKLNREKLLIFAIAAMSENLRYMNTLQMAYMWNLIMKEENIEKLESEN